jgi:hypothetical protein
MSRYVVLILLMSGAALALAPGIVVGRMFARRSRSVELHYRQRWDPVLIHTHWLRRRRRCCERRETEDEGGGGRLTCVYSARVFVRLCSFRAVACAASLRAVFCKGTVNQVELMC